MIGVFDSGIGGLTVAKAIVDLLPQENMIYVGDTAHFPYGDKSAAVLQDYALTITKMLVQQGCRVLLIACNSASAAADQVLRERWGDEILIVNVIDPMVNFICTHYKRAHIGLIGTRQTVQSHFYPRKISEQNKRITLHALATPLLAPAIEEEGAEPRVIDPLLQDYLSHPNLAGIEALILGCTHYPLIKDRITAFYQNKIDIIDGSTIVARSLVKLLLVRKERQDSGEGKRRFYVSDLTENVTCNAKRFFGDDIVLERCPDIG